MPLNFIHILIELAELVWQLGTIFTHLHLFWLKDNFEWWQFNSIIPIWFDVPPAFQTQLTQLWLHSRLRRIEQINFTYTAECCSHDGNPFCFIRHKRMTHKKKIKEYLLQLFIWILFVSFQNIVWFSRILKISMLNGFGVFTKQTRRDEFVFLYSILFN